MQPLKVFFLTIFLCCYNQVLSQNLRGKPNIIFIMADDLGFETLSCYGNDINNTPNLDKMADQGMRFTHAYSTPLCTPTRVQLMTGKYSFRNYVGFGILDNKEKTFADLLKDAGYITAVTGKWQLLGNKKQRKLAGGVRGAYPEEVGFDQYCLWQIDTLGSRYKDPVISTPEGTKIYPGEYAPDIFTKFAIDFIEENQDRSFFLYYPMVLTHDPFQPTPDTEGFRSSDIKKRENNPTHFKDMVEYMDKLIGKISGKVHELGLSKNTLIIFVGDNGTSRKITSTLNGRKITGGKGSTTSIGAHVPMIAYWNGVIQGGQVNDNLIDFTDFLPSFLDVAGTSIPDGFIADGRSFYKQLLNKKTKTREWVFCHYEPRWKTDIKETWVHDKNWKLYRDGRFFNIQDDPEESEPIPEADLTLKMQKVKKEFNEVLEGMMGSYN